MNPFNLFVATTSIQNLNGQVQNLSLKVNSFESYLNNTLLLYSTYILFILALFLALQFIWARHIENSKMKELEGRMKAFVNSFIGEKEKILMSQMQTKLDEDILSFKNEMFLTERSVRSETARLLALASENLNSYEKATINWLQAADNRNSIGAEKERTKDYLKFAEENLIKITNLEDLKNDMDQIKMILRNLKELFPFEVEQIEKELQKKITS